MGYIVHEVVAVTLYDDNDVKRCAAFIEDVEPKSFRRLFAILPATTNGYTTVVMAPDGSKEGWAESDRGDGIRARFKKLIAGLGGRGFHATMAEDRDVEIKEVDNKWTADAGGKS